MNPRNTFILVAVAAALFAFIFFFERHLHRNVPPPVRVVPGLRPASVTGLQLLLPGQKISLQRTNGTWQIIYPLPYPAQSQAVETLVRVASLLSPQTRISAQELKGRRDENAEFGFNNPQATLVFEQGTEQYILKLGSLTMPGNQIYAQVVGLANVDIIDADFFRKLVPHHVNEWRDTSFVTLTNLAFDQLTVDSGSQHFELQRNGTNDSWRMTKPVRSRADNPKIGALLTNLQNLHVTRFVTDDARADLEPFGLQPAVLALKFDHGTNHVLTLQFGKSPTNDEAQIYARRNSENTILQLPRVFVSPWMAGFQEFRDLHLVRLADAPPDLIEATDRQSGQSFTLQKSNDEWHLIKPLELPVDTNVMHAFLTNLAGLQVARTNNLVLVDDAALLEAYGLAQPARRYVLKRSIGGTNQVLAELDFGSITNGHVSARRADRPEESSVYSVSVADYSKLPVNDLQLRKRRIWNFSEDNVNWIAIRQNGQTQKWVHEGPNHWKMSSGSGMFNELEVEVGAQELGFLEAQDWVERGAQNLARYGLTNQSLQISVEVKQDGKPQTLTVDLGGTAPDGLRYGAARMEDGLVWVFEVPSIQLDRLTAYFNIHEHRGS